MGDEEGNGFLLSPFSFIYACISIVDPEIDGLFIRVEGGYSIVIEDDRLVWRNGGWVVPGVSR